jgi:formylglycine-generating enzyme required for sulfatase activity
MSQKNALVIGVSDYEHISPLDHTVNDAEDMAKALRKLGFAVMLETNPTLAQFLSALKRFSADIKYNKDIALFYYSGHGIQSDGENYLIPKNAEIDDMDLIKRQGVGLAEVINKVSDANNSLNIFILDACRDNPFKGRSRSVSASRGLAEIKEMPPSTYIAYAAAAGKTADDGNKNERNGIFTGVFLETLIEHPTVELDRLFRKIRTKVLRKTRQAQEPWTNHNLGDEDYYLIEPKSEAVKDNREGDSLEFKKSQYAKVLKYVYADKVVTVEEREVLNEEIEELEINTEQAIAWEKEYRKRIGLPEEIPADKTNFNPYTQILVDDYKNAQLEKQRVIASEELKKYEDIKKEKEAQKERVRIENDRKAELEKKKQEEEKRKEIPKTFTNSIGMEFVLIPAGEYMMGASPDDMDASDNEKPAHKVKITKPFYMGKYPVTQKQWIDIMGNNPSIFVEKKIITSNKPLENHPVESISWNDVQEFLKKLNKKEGKNYRLPTEAEWEYAARAGSTTKYYSGNEIDDAYLWYTKNSDGKTHPVGQKKPNAFGLYDMLGNVWEWTNDWYDKEYYSKSPSNDPTGPESGSDRVLRGGSWDSLARSCRSSYHIIITPVSRNNSGGFRVVLFP